jgi:hypothetical protein
MSTQERYDSCDFCQNFVHITARAPKGERCKNMPPNAKEMKNLKVNYVSKFECRALQMSFLPEYSYIFKKGVGSVRRRPYFCNRLDLFLAIAGKIE